MVDRPQDGEGARPGMSLPTKLAVASALGAGALLTGFLATRQGRRMVAETFRGRVRTPLEYDVLDVFDADRSLKKRRLDAREEEPGLVSVLGAVASEEERETVVRLASGVRGVEHVRDGLRVEPGKRRGG